MYVFARRLCTRYHRRRSPRFVVFAVLAAGAFTAPHALAQDRPSDRQMKVILSNLPPRGSRAHKDLLGLAGKEAKVQVLGFSQSEMWSMPRSRMGDVLGRGEHLGVKAIKLGTDWNHVLKPPSGQVSITGAQASILKAVEGSKETMAGAA